MYGIHEAFGCFIHLHCTIITELSYGSEAVCRTILQCFVSSFCNVCMMCLHSRLTSEKKCSFALSMPYSHLSLLEFVDVSTVALVVHCPVFDQWGLQVMTLLFHYYRPGRGALRIHCAWQPVLSALVPVGLCTFPALSCSPLLLPSVPPAPPRIHLATCVNDQAFRPNTRQL